MCRCIYTYYTYTYICSSTASRAICCSGQQSDLTTPIIPLQSAWVVTLNGCNPPISPFFCFLTLTAAFSLTQMSAGKLVLHTHTHFHTVGGRHCQQENPIPFACIYGEKCVSRQTWSRDGVSTSKRERVREGGYKFKGRGFHWRLALLWQPPRVTAAL